LSWVFLIIAGCFEVAGTTVFRYIEGLSKPWPIALFVACGVTSLYFLFRSLESIPVGTAYAVWTGIGAAGTVLIGMIYFSEPVTLPRIGLLIVLIAAIIGLKLV
jgi:quaternary ammonium compound-resistance protein SugE